MEEKERLKFPIQGAEVCPHCGCKERIGEQLIRELKEDGKLSKMAFPKGALAIQVPLFDQTRPPLATQIVIPMLQIMFDVCKECKTIYCTDLELTQQPAKVEFQQVKQPRI